MCGLVAGLVKTLERLYSSKNSDGLNSYQVSLGLFASIAILLIACTLVNSVLCILNFNKGLKDHIDQLRGTKRASDLEGAAAQGPKSRFVLN
jgi:hypothetical protein